MKSLKITNRVKIYAIIFTVVLLLASAIFIKSDYLVRLNNIVLIITLGVLIWYTYDTHRIANQAVESSLRPVILREGKILDWVVSCTEQVIDYGYTLHFHNMKNIAKDITGYIVLSNKKYKLHFGNLITEDLIVESNIPRGKKTILFEKWGWLPVDGIIYASYISDVYEVVDAQNCWYIEYQDIEGNKYYTSEDSEFSQQSNAI
jgi:hypothetical protein